MKYALNIAEDKRILSAWKVLSNDCYDGMPLVDVLPQGNIYEYRYMDSAYIHDPLPDPRLPEPEATVWDELDAAYQEGVNRAYDQ